MDALLQQESLTADVPVYVGQALINGTYFQCEKDTLVVPRMTVFSSSPLPL